MKTQKKYPNSHKGNPQGQSVMKYETSNGSVVFNNTTEAIKQQEEELAYS